jgi:hypothetical protein
MPGLIPRIGSHGLDKEAVYAAIGGKLGVEGSRKHNALPHQDCETLAAGQNLDAGSGGNNAWGADKDHLERAAGECSLGGEDRGVDLATVGIALDNGIEDSEAALRGIMNLPRQQDGPGTCSEDGLLVTELL